MDGVKGPFLGDLRPVPIFCQHSGCFGFSVFTVTWVWREPLLLLRFGVNSYRYLGFGVNPFQWLTLP